MTAPSLSIVVIFHNMRREAARTLYSLSSQYQTGIGTGDYEVIAIDNGSAAQLNAEQVQSRGPNFRYRFFETESVLLIVAVNAGAAMAQGDLQGIAAPEMRELMGRESYLSLVQIAEGKEVVCQLDGTQANRRPVGVCFVGGQDIGRAQVEAGFARDCAAYSKGRYREAEMKAARQATIYRISTNCQNTADRGEGQR